MSIRLLLSLLLTLGFTNAMPVDLSSISVGVADDDSYILEFIKSIKTDKVTFKKGTLKLYADPSSGAIIFTALAAMALGSVGLGASTYAAYGEGNGRALFGGVGCGALAAWLAWRAINATRHKLSNYPYIVLNNDGINVVGEKKIAWEVIDHIEREKTVLYNEWGSVIRRTQVVHLQDKFRTTLLSIPDYYLPVSLDNLVALVEHYWHCNSGSIGQAA
jgi:hypothetical protein